MNENARKWVAALRSGEFKQGRGSLRVDDAYCCLGVACEVYRRDVGGSWDEFVFRCAGSRYGFCAHLPSVVAEWLGLCDVAGDYRTGADVYRSLIDDNDSGASFEQIADLIESGPEGLFVKEQA